MCKRNFSFNSVCLGFFLVSACFVVNAREVTAFDVTNVSIDVRIFKATGNRLLLGFACDEGRSHAEEQTAAALAAGGVEVWMPDMLSAYMLPNLPSSRHEIPTDALLGLIEKALATGKEVYLIASGKDTELVLRVASVWEDSHEKPLSGAILLFPRLFKAEPVPGVIPEYVDVVGKTKLPLILLEGERTPNRWGVKSLSSQLEIGGSQVVSQLIPSVRGYFFKRPDANRSEEMATAKLPDLIMESLLKLEHMHVKN